MTRVASMNRLINTRNTILQPIFQNASQKKRINSIVEETKLEGKKVYHPEISHKRSETNLIITGKSKKRLLSQLDQQRMSFQPVSMLNLGAGFSTSH